MLALADNLSQSIDALRQHKLRAVLTVIGLTMGVATLITVMTLVQGANVYVEQKIARLGTNVFQIARTPFIVTDFNLVIKALRYKNLYMDDVRTVAEACGDCQVVGASMSGTARAQYRDKELNDISLAGHTPSMSDIDSRVVLQGRYFTDSENQRSAYVCLIGDDLQQQLFLGVNPIGQVIRLDNQEFTITGTMERIGSVLGQNQDNFAIVPMNTFLRMRGSRSSLTIQAKTSPGTAFDDAQDEARLALRARRHVRAGAEDDFFIGTKDSYISLWQSISSAFFAVFIMVSSISAVVGGIVIMNVMLVSVTERTKEIGIRRAMGATQQDIMRQFLSESVDPVFDWWGGRHTVRIPVRRGAADVHFFPGVGADLGGDSRSGAELDHRTIFRNLPSHTRGEAGPGGRPASRMTTVPKLRGARSPACSVHTRVNAKQASARVPTRHARVRAPQSFQS